MSLRVILKIPVKRFLPRGSVSVFTNEKIGKREVVGFGINGTNVYVDKPDFPFPAIRFKEDTPEIDCLRAKEKCDWKQLTVEEKKALYRSSFCQTYSEYQTFSGDWKQHLGLALAALGTAMLIVTWEKYNVLPSKPESFNEDRQKAQLKRMLDLEMNPIDGLSSKWDYDKKRWK